MQCHPRCRRRGGLYTRMYALLWAQISSSPESPWLRINGLGQDYPFVNPLVIGEEAMSEPLKDMVSAIHEMSRILTGLSGIIGSLFKC
jgi:hypothetical protein